MKRLLAVIACTLLLAACNSGNPSTPSGSSSNTSSSQSSYLTELDWADTSNYMCAVEDPSFDGDVISAGTYTAKSVGAATSKGDIMVVWDIYVSDNCYNSLSDLKEDEYVLSVGGIDKSGGEITVKAGQYLYIKYNDVLGNPCGYVSLELKEQ